MKLSLIVMTPGKQQGQALEIKTPQFLVGRDPQCQLRPASPLISNRHCAILIREGKVFLRDFDSKNGTFVNNEAIKGERELKNDDQLKIGPLEFAVRMEAKTTTATAAASAPVGKPPAQAAAPASKSAEADDDALAMLLGGDESSGTETATTPTVPSGGTVADMKIPAEKPATEPTEAAKAPPPKSAEADTRSAAASILEKMTKMPRK
ncbi:MAG: FHA domain-containing protein [Planctomycetia bacterium]|nr:FHA domain-containing protein [Planctomycetia bacterium]